MKLKEMFAKPIDRDIKGVIKVGQDESENIKQELEEYVVTRELQKHFAEFFSSYKRGITGTTDKMGVWISGFFGSGKSHFLKILSYLLDNREVDGKHAIDYFIEDDKIADSMVLADMKLAADTPADVILFNVDSKGESTGKQDKDAIVSVFLKAFNEMQGFCGAYPHVADLERRLRDEGRLEDYIGRFDEINGDSWEEERYAIDFIQDDIVETLSSIGFMSEEAARNWCEKATEPYEISIERFAELVRRYIESKGNDHHVVFLVDEIGQYIGEDTKLMLNLQTVTEDLGTACSGKTWVIVTSQQDIDSITKTKGNDFSKIQGRFDTRLSLSSANADEVIKKRILEKNDTGTDTLTLLYDEKETIIKNLIMFNDGIEKKLYSDRNNFAEVYPFIPYQFNLLGSVLTAIRTFGASGKHLADGERSLLALFKESAMRVMNEEPGAIVPFSMFYEPLEEFIDHSHKSVIIHALDNEYLNPEHAADCFEVDLLKTLFMIKYVKEIKANIENLTSLMVSHIDEDRLQLKEKVETALKKLIRQTLVQKSGECYVFLTNEEQEINRAIGDQNVEPAETTAKVSEMIFDDIYDVKKYRYPAMGGRYSYGFNQIVDERPYKANQNYPMTLKILTPDSDELSDDRTMRMLSGQSRCVLVVIPDDRSFLDEIRSALQIEKFIRFDATNAVTKYEQIKADKKQELREHSEQAGVFLREALRNADIYVNGDKVESSAKEAASRINDAMGKLASSVFHKLTYMDHAVSEADIRSVLKESARQMTMENTGAAANRLALDDVDSYISLNTSRHTKTSMKSVMDRFMSPPYGFLEADVQWLVARLFKDGDISFYVNNEAVSLMSKSPEDIARYITRKEFGEKLMMEKRVRANEKQKKAVREVMKELFYTTPQNDDDDELMKNFIRYAGDLRNELQQREVYYKAQPLYPGSKIIAEGKKLLGDVMQMKYASEFFKCVYDAKDDLLDFAEDYEPVKKFFKGEQKEIFDRAIKLMDIYDDSKTFIVDSRIEGIVSDVRAIMKKASPYGEIYKLPGLLDEFVSVYNDVLADMEGPVLASIADARSRVMDELSDKQCREQLEKTFIKRFEEIKEKAERCNNVAVLQKIEVEADALKVRCLNEIGAAEQHIIEQAAAREAEKKKQEQLKAGAAQKAPVVSDNVKPAAPPKPKVKKRRTVSIRQLNTARTWQLETEADVIRYISQLQQKLMDTLEEDTVIDVEF